MGVKTKISQALSLGSNLCRAIVFYSSLTFVRASIGSLVRVSRTTGSWGARCGLEFQYLTIFYLNITISNYEDCVFHSYKIDFLQPVFSWWFMKWIADFLGVFFFYIINIPTFSKITTIFLALLQLAIPEKSLKTWHCSLCQAQAGNHKHQKITFTENFGTVGRKSSTKNLAAQFFPRAQTFRSSAEFLYKSAR